MSVSRRKFLSHGSTALVAAALPLKATRAHALSPFASRHAESSRDDATVRALVATALDAARRAGATYADARHIVMEGELYDFANFPLMAPDFSLTVGIGVRALYQGYWGYAALVGLDLTPDAVARVGQEATAQAKTNAKGPSREVVLAPTPVVQNGMWTTPIEIDPFTVPWGEKRDVINAVRAYYEQQPFDAGAITPAVRFQKSQQSFGSTEGSSYTQTLYQTGLMWMAGFGPHWRTNKSGGRLGESVVSTASAGWEYLLKAPFEPAAPELLRQANDARFAVPVDIGRYDVVFDGAALGAIADVTLGSATELDRAMGYTANTEGTSYINDPLNMVGELQMGSPALTVTANRSMPRGVATVKWDDEGVEPDEAVLVKNGVLTDFQTTRESASWLAKYYAKIGKPLRSHGGALCTNINGAPTQGAHNLVLAPSAKDTSFEDLCSGVKKGLAVLSASSTSVDQQALNGTMTGNIVYEIKNGKLGRVVDGAVLLTRAPDFWKNLQAVGGASTVCTVGMNTRFRHASGGQERPHSVMAPAGLVKQVAVTTNVARVV